MAEERRYEVRGVDDLGDVHVFLTDDLERAEGVRDQLREDLEHVELTDKNVAASKDAAALA